MIWLMAMGSERGVDDAFGAGEDFVEGGEVGHEYGLVDTVGGGCRLR